MNDQLKLGIIGAGALATNRIYPCFSRLNVELAAVCDLDEAKARENAQRFGGKNVYTDYRTMLDNESLDGVVICIGPDQHAHMAQEVMRSALPVYTEKPPAISAEQALQVLKTSRETGQICMTAFKKRFAPVYKRAKEIITSESFGDPALLSIDYASGLYTNDPSNPRSVFLLDFTLHIIDLQRFLFGEVDELLAWKRGYDSYVVSLKYQSGAIGTLALTDHRSWRVPTEKLEITGSNREFISTNNSVQLWHYREDKLVESMEPNFSTAAGDSLRETGFLGELEEFVAAIREKRQPESSIESSTRTMLIHDCIKQSAETGQVVKPDYSILE